LRRVVQTAILALAAIVMTGCAGQSFILPSSTGAIQVAGQGAVRAAESTTFTATLPKGATGGVQWSVNGVVGGDRTHGTISSAGLYQAPAAVPTNNLVTIQATSLGDGAIVGSLEIRLLNPVPTVFSVAATDKGGFFDIDITGSNFVTGAVAKVNGTAVSGEVISSTKMKAVVASSITTASSVEVSVANPEPGTAASEDIICLLQRATRPLRPALAEPSLPATPFDYVAYAVTNLPTHFQDFSASDNTPQSNPITNAGATLGRVLFYDKRLSINNTVSCASCHLQSRGFEDPNQFSIGVNGNTPRHGMALSNAKFYQRGRFFWDERAATLEEQTLQPIQNSIEMGLTLPELITKLQATTFYPQLFQNAFGTPEITTDRVSKALAQFIRSMVSYQSKLDQVIVGQGQVTLSSSELLGRQLFNGSGKCSSCHNATVQIAVIPENNGLDAVTVDPGVGQGRFKVPSLRNVATHARFMHDGRFTSLDQVIEFYNSGIQANPDLSPVQKDGLGNPLRHNWTPDQKAGLVAFLQTLTDTTFLNDPKFSNPFPQ
jgi:cytochrome c peroxidase